MKIKCAAIQGVDGRIIEGRSHADAYKLAHPDENFRRAKVDLLQMLVCL
jgi:hypothetical protein